MTEPTKKPASTYVDFGVNVGGEWAKNSEQATVYNNGEADNVDGLLGGGGVKISAGYFLPELKGPYRLGLGGQIVAGGALNRVDYYKIDTDGQSYNGEHVKNARTIGVGLLFNPTASFPLGPVKANSGADADAVTSDPKPASFELGLLIGPSLLAGYRPLNNGVNGALPGTQPLQGLGLTVGAEATYFLGVGEGKGDLGINLRFTSIRAKTAEGALREERVPLRTLSAGITWRKPSIPEQEPAPAPAPVEPVVVAPPPAEPAVDQDPDKDGILGTEDACPPVPEDKDGYADTDGCPDTDNDNDNILDATTQGLKIKPEDGGDLCPDAAEVINGFEDTDGCPDSSTTTTVVLAPVPPPVVEEPERVEWDVVYLKADGTRSETEAVGYNAGEESLDPDGDTITNSTEKRNGTNPNSADSDNDLIPDYLDVEDTISIAGDVDGDAFPAALDQDSDNDGKPDGKDGTKLLSNVPQGIKNSKGMVEPLDVDKDAENTLDFIQMNVVIEGNQITLKKTVYFESDKDTIKPESYDLLKQVASLLQQNPQIKEILVEGHTDDVGKPDYNQDLSERRAKSVKKYLDDQEGVNTEIKFEGYGETRPVEPVPSNAPEKYGNIWDDEREKNRRVVITITKQEEAK